MQCLGKLQVESFHRARLKIFGMCDGGSVKEFWIEYSTLKTKIRGVFISFWA